MKEITFDDLRQLLLYRRIVKWNDDRFEFQEYDGATFDRRIL